jgi:uncharacterized membrane protein
MKKQQYLDELKKSLEKAKVADVDDIIFEYAQHFDFKLADGFTDEEIAAKLGNVNDVAAQFAESGVKTNTKVIGGKPLVYTGLGVSNIGTGMFFTLFAAWTVVLGAVALAFLFTAGLLLTGTNIANLVPPMPYINKFLFSFPIMALSVLSALGTIYCFLYMKQLCRAYARWHRNIVAAAKQKPILPSLAKHPQLAPKTKRKLRNIFAITFAVFGIMFIIAYAVAAIKAGNFEFWHVWEWFA